MVDCFGLLLMVLVTPADVTDRDAACGMLARHRKIRLVWADGGYAGRLVDWARQKLRLTLEIVKRSDDMRGFVVLPRRWCVERTLGWLMRSRRLTRDYRATSRFALTRTPSTFAGTNSRPNRAARSFARSPSLPLSASDGACGRHHLLRFLTLQSISPLIDRAVHNFSREPPPPSSHVCWRRRNGNDAVVLPGIRVRGPDSEGI
ncbi:transposase [Streptomyces sp. NPDC005500]|uniref:transposase n=1 Tax=Streptomyces sp. NPDC005500 TaxID=3155007 RepID=UPI0033B36478